MKFLIRSLLLANIAVAMFWAYSYWNLTHWQSSSRPAVQRVAAAARNNQAGETIRRAGRLARETGRTQVVALISKVSTTCPVGKTVELLKGLAQDLDVMVVVPRDFAAVDVKNFRFNHDLNYPVKIADIDLDRLWKDLEAEHGVGFLNGVTFVFSGERISVVRTATELRALIDKNPGDIMQMYLLEKESRLGAKSSRQATNTKKERRKP